VPAKTRILAVEDDEWCLEVKVILLDRVPPAIDEIELIWRRKCDERFRKYQLSRKPFLPRLDRFLKAPKQARTATRSNTMTVPDFFALSVWRFMIVQARMSQRHP